MGSVRKKRALSQSAAKEKVPWPSRRVSSCRSRTTETIILSNSTRMPKGRQKKRIPQVDGIERRKKEQQRGGTKEDKSLRGTTIKLVCVIPVIKTKHQSKRTQGNVRSPGVATRQINTAGHQKKRQAATTER